MFVISFSTFINGSPFGKQSLAFSPPLGPEVERGTALHLIIYKSHIILHTQLFFVKDECSLKLI